MKAQTEQNTLADITSGKYRGHYLIYARRSTDEPESQKNSIAYQKSANGRFARAERLAIAPLTVPGLCTDGVVSERHSAFKEGAEMAFGHDGTVTYRIERPKFHRLASLLGDGYFKGVIFLCWDRASRNKGDELILSKLAKAGVDVRFALATYDDTSAGELHKDIDGMFAEHHSRVTREKVSLTIQHSRDRGLCVQKAPVGYLNQGSMASKPFDPERAPIIRQLYEKCDESDWSLSDLRRWLIAQGFTMPASHRHRTREEMLEDEELDERRVTEKVAHLPSLSKVHSMLTSPFYAGWVRGNAGSWVKSISHEALVSQALFDRVQAKLSRRRTSQHYEKKLQLPFRAFLRCECGRVYTPYVRKGITYYGARCDRSCPNRRKSVNLRFVHETVGGLVGKLNFTDEELAEIDRKTESGYGNRTARFHAERDASDRQMRKHREDLAYLTDNRLTLLRTGAFTPESLAAEEARLNSALQSADANEGVSADDIRQIPGHVAKLSELLKRAQFSCVSANDAKRERVGRHMFSELTLSENTLDYLCRTPFKQFDRSNFSFSALDSWLSELCGVSGELKTAIAELEELLAETDEDVPPYPGNPEGGGTKSPKSPKS